MQTGDNLEASIAQFESYIKADPNNHLLWLSVGDLYHRAGRFDEAIACYERCLIHAPGHPPARSGLASVMISQHRFDEAEKLLRGLVEQGDTNAAVLHNLGLALFYQDRWDQARQCFSDAATRGLRTPSTFAYLSRCCHHLGLMPEAIEACRTWSELATSGDSRGYLALLEMDNGNMAQASAVADEVLAEQPEQIDASVVAGTAAIERQNIGYARGRFSLVLQKQPNHPRAWLGIGLVHLFDGEHEQAIDALQRATRLMPTNAGTMVTLGWAQLVAKHVGAAEASFRQAIAIERNFSESHGGLATTLALSGRADEANEEIKVALRLDPRSFGAVFAKTIMLKMRGKERAATELLAKALQQSPAPDAPALIEHLLTYMNSRQTAKSPTEEPKR